MPSPIVRTGGSPAIRGPFWGLLRPPTSRWLYKEPLFTSYF